MIKCVGAMNHGLRMSKVIFVLKLKHFLHQLTYMAERYINCINDMNKFAVIMIQSPRTLEAPPHDLPTPIGSAIIFYDTFLKNWWICHRLILKFPCPKYYKSESDIRDKTRLKVLEKI